MILGHRLKQFLSKGTSFVQTNNGQIPPVASRKPIAGLLGMVSLISGPYLLVVTRKVGVVPQLNDILYSQIILGAPGSAVRRRSVAGG